MIEVKKDNLRNPRDNQEETRNLQEVGNMPDSVVAKEPRKDSVADKLAETLEVDGNQSEADSILKFPKPGKTRAVEQEPIPKDQIPLSSFEASAPIRTEKRGTAVSDLIARMRESGLHASEQSDQASEALDQRKAA